MDVHPGAHGTVTPGLAPALSLRAVTKRFGVTTALDDASLIVRPGTIHALLGENGAGKTTLMRVAYGLERADRATIERNGAPLTIRSPRDANAAGIGMVHQHFSLVPAMSVAENVVLGGRGRFAAAEAQAQVRAIGAQSGLVVDPAARVGDLPVGAQQRVEIIKAFAHNASLLILDEPTAVLTESESQELMARLRAFAAAGNAVVLITHKLREALAAADDVSVLRRGKTVLTGAARDLAEAEIVSAMVGTLAAPAAQTTVAPSARVVFRLSHADAEDERRVVRLRDASCDVHAGEIVGIAGVEGNGQRELLRVLAGRLRPTAGTIERPAVVGFVPEDRQHDAVVLDFTLTENLALAEAGNARGVMPWRALHDATRAVMAQFDVRAPSERATVRSLSGGNQQRFVLGRELRLAPAALVAENPSRGLDIRATASVHEQLRDARRAGAAIVLYTSDLDELLALADRVLVCFSGTVREVERRTPDIARAMTGTLV